MKTLTVFLVLVAMLIGAFVWDMTKQTCSFEYDTAFNGLYLYKEKVCYGRLGMRDSHKIVARKPLFTEF